MVDDSSSSRARIALVCACVLIAACGSEETTRANAITDPGFNTMAGAGGLGGVGGVSGAAGVSGSIGGAGSAGGIGGMTATGGSGGIAPMSCPAGVTMCGALCIDTQTDAASCGACGVACTGGQICTAGRCACAPGQTQCDGTCTDLQMNPAHCGECARACDAGEMCMAGLCRGALGADGCTGDALGVTLRQIDSYQSVQIPIMQDGDAVTFYERKADVIAGHDMLFRVSVDVDPGFVARELSARVTLFNDGREDQYFAKQRISGSSRDEDTSSTFQIPIPAERVQAETRYAVELVECGAGSGMQRASRFPATGDVKLEPLTTGVLKVAIVPVRANSRVADTSIATLEIYRDYIMAMYPVSDVELTVTSEISTGYPIDWSELLDQIRDKRQADSPPDDVYYYGWVKATDTYAQFCSGACTLGIGFVVTNTNDVDARAAVGIAFADEGSAWTMAHEVAHNHGRNHAPCGVSADADGNYPYANGGAGVWGYDARRQAFLDPDDTNDLMGYCNPKWISDYTFQGIANRIATLNGTAMGLSGPVVEGRWQVILLGERGARWGRPYQKARPPFGAPEQAEVLDASGNVVAQITAYRTEMGHEHGAATVLVPQRELGWHSVRLQGTVDVAFDAP